MGPLKPQCLKKGALGSLAKVILDNRIALDYILAEQGGICALVNCCSKAANQGIKTQVMQDNAQLDTRKYL